VRGGCADHVASYNAEAKKTFSIPPTPNLPHPPPHGPAENEKPTLSVESIGHGFFARVLKDCMVKWSVL